MRFILNFILFGILFYIIYLYFPEAFATLVTWVRDVFDFLRDTGNAIVEKVRGATTDKPQHPAPVEHALLALCFLSNKIKF